MNDKDYMRLALQLAKKGCGWTSPNPMVGAVVVKEGRIIGQGWHQRYGQAHAERNALASCTEDPQGATMYVTLEPCCHYGKQPPCVDAILDAGIHRVVVGSADPNPLVAGKGIAILRAHGIDVTENVLQEECDALNKVFFHYITTKRPFVSMKYAMTMDGKIATYTGASKWITGEIARTHVQRQRHRFRGIMVGVGTILADDPLLTCRIEGGRDPVRIICDTHLRTPLQSQVVTTAKTGPHHSCDLLRRPREAGGISTDRVPSPLSGRAMRSCESSATDGTAGAGADRQHSAGRRRNLELVCTGKRHRAAGTGLHRPEAVRR